MLERLQSSLRTTLSLLLQMEPNQQSRSMLLVLLFVIVANVASNAVYEALDLPIWVTPAFLVALIGAAILWSGWQSARAIYVIPPRTGDRPAPHSGLVLFLSLFHSRGDQQTPGLAGQDWRRQELQAALDDPNVGWPTILERFTHSNMRPALEAIRHHLQDGVLQHVWLISTLDLQAEDGRIRQEGSHRFAPLLARVIEEGLRWKVNIHHVDPALHIMPYDTTAAYRAVEYVFLQATRQVNLEPHQVIADLTGGRVPMTGGMILACAPRNWAMQYTTTDRDPAKGGPGDTPVPLSIEIEARALWLCALDAMRQEVDRRS